jgi:hypothetical protein
MIFLSFRLFFKVRKIFQVDLKEPSRLQYSRPLPKRFQTVGSVEKEGAPVNVTNQTKLKDSSPSIDDIEITFESVEEIEVGVPAIQTNTKCSFLTNPDLTTIEVENSSLTTPNIQIFKLNNIVDDSSDLCEIVEERDAATSLDNQKDDILSDDISLLVANAISDEVLGDSVSASPTKIPSSNFLESPSKVKDSDPVDSICVSAKVHPTKRKIFSTKVPAITPEKRGRGPAHQSPTDVGPQILREKVKLETNKPSYKY